MPQEVEIKFRIDDVAALTGKLHACGFQLKTPRTHEMNVLYDLPGQPLRQKGEILRLREYGGDWIITYKSQGTEGRHKSRRELETRIADGQAMTEIMEALGFSASFRYEKFRTEWSDSHGHVVIDETPIGNFGEIEGTAEWIDAVARQLEISEEQYITSSYAQLFFLWKQQTGSQAEEMTFNAVK